MDRTARVIAAETAVVREQFRRNMVGWLPGRGAVRGRPHGADRGLRRGDPRRAHRDRRRHASRRGPDSVEFDDRTIIDSDGLLKLDRRVPRSMTVVGAGVIGVEYASMFGALGTKVTVVDQRDRTLDFLDGEIGEAFQYLLRRSNVTFRLREKVDAIESVDGPRADPARLGQGDRLRDRALRGRAPGRHGRARDREHRAGGRQARAAGASTSDFRTVGAAHLRRRRRGRRRPRRDRDGAGPDRRAARVRPAGHDAARSWSRPASTRSPRSAWSARPRRS